VAYSILAKGDGKMYLISETLSGLIGLVLNVVGYSFFGFAGLGVSYILWYVAYTIIVTVIGRSRYGVTVNRSVWRLSALGLLVGIVAIALKCCVGWWLALIFGIVIAPYALRRLFK
jgi:O-antigen/teichoic acid export membrane protein